MSNIGFTARALAQPHFKFTICPSQAVMLADVFRPGTHNKSLKVTACDLEISTNSPSRCAIAPSDASAFLHGLDKLWYPRCIRAVFDGDQDRANGIGYLKVPMGDGPHRSLPMKPKCRSVAERAYNRAFGLDDISTAMMPALVSDCQHEITPRFIDSLRGICEQQETLLFKDDIQAQLEALRPEAGTGMGRHVLENAVRLSKQEEVHRRESH